MHNEGNYKQGEKAAFRMAEKIVNKTTDKEIIFKIYKQLMQLNTRKINDPIKNWAKELNGHTPRKTHMRLTNMKSDAQRRSLSVQFSSVTQSCPTLCDPMNHSTPGLPVHHQLLEFTQTHVHQVGDAIQPSHPLSPPSPPALNLSQHWSLFQRVSSLHQVAKVLEFQLQHQSFQWISRTDVL